LSVRAAREIYKGYQQVDSLADNISSAFLLQIAGKDPVVDSVAAQGFFDRACKKKIDATLKVYPNCLHEIYNEIEREQAIDDAILWLKNH
jgi:alpha-beta hydrolase superfamily lysophospholipase